MSTSFNFPPNPTLNQVVVLPDGNSAQWNGYAWVSVGDNVTYPLAVPKGGTGATNPSTARINLGLNTATGEFIVQKDGDVNAPGLAFASEPGLGWYRPGAGTLNFAEAGATVQNFNVATPALTQTIFYPRAPGVASVYMRNQAAGVAAFNQLGFLQNADGSARIETGAGGGASRGILTIDAPVTSFIANGGSATIELNKAAGNFNNDIFARRAGVSRWLLRMGDGVAEAGGNAGSDFLLYRYSDAGVTLGGGTTLQISRATGNATFSGTLAAANGMGLRWDGGASNFLCMGAGVGTAWSWQWNRSNGALTWLNDATSALIVFDQAGNASKASAGTAWLNISDKRAKKDIEDWDGGLDEVLSLRPRKFTRIDTGERAIGCVADEAEVGFGALIRRAPGKVGDVEYDDLAQLYIDPLFWAMVNSFKTIHQRLSQLEQA